jgi:hypothetical protein
MPNDVGNLATNIRPLHPKVTATIPSRRSRAAPGTPNAKRAKKQGPEQLDSLVMEIATIRPRAALQTMLEVGRIVVDRLFDGNIEAMRNSRGPGRTLRKLAGHPHLPLSPVALWRALGIYQLAARFPELLSAPQLTASHFRAVLGLPPETQYALLRTADRESMTTAELERRVTTHRARYRRATSHKAAFDRLMRELRRVGVELDRHESLDLASDAAASDIEEAVSELRRVQTGLEELVNALEKRRAGRLSIVGARAGVRTR